MILELPELKEIRWQGDAREIAHQFPKGARMRLGKELTRIQVGLQPRNGKWLTGVGRGVQEIRIACNREAYRVIYVVTLGDCIYVLHAFQKKSKSGNETPREEIEVAINRYARVIRSLSGN